MKDRYDAIIIGAGHNGLTCACYLAKAGLKTLVVEKNSVIGGLSITEEITLPGFHSDLHAYGYQFANLSPALHELNLLKYNLEFLTPTLPFAHIFPTGNSIQMHLDLQATMASLAQFSQEDALQWQTLFSNWRKIKNNIMMHFNAPPPPLSVHFKQLEDLPNGLDEFRFEMQSLRGWCQEWFKSEENQCFLGTLAMHGNVGVDDAGGGKLAWLFACVMQDFGNKVIKGGMINLPKSLAACLRELNGDIITTAAVKKISIENKRARGIELINGDFLHADKLIAASIDPKTLIVDLLGENVIGKTITKKIMQYEWGPSILVIYLALDGPLEFIAGEIPAKAAYIHASPGTLNFAAQMMVECRAGLLPKEPVIIICNDYISDPTRVPRGKGLVKILVKNVPYVIKGDAAGKITSTHWDEAKEFYADRVIEQLQRHYISNIKQRILKRVVHSPLDQERKISSAVHGTELQGAFLPYQSGPLRPIPELGHYKTPIDNVYLCGSGSYPGPGISFMPGRNAAQVIYQDLNLAWKNSYVNS